MSDVKEEGNGLTTTSGEEWLTIAEAARRIGIDPRQARRYADRLDETDRTVSEKRPIRVRIEALARLWQQSRQGQMRLEGALRLEGQCPKSVDIVTSDLYASIQNLGAVYERLLSEQMAANSALLAEKDARIKDLQRTVERLAGALSREQALHGLSTRAEESPEPAQQPALAPTLRRAQQEAGKEGRRWWKFW